MSDSKETPQLAQSFADALERLSEANRLIKSCIPLFQRLPEGAHELWTLKPLSVLYDSCTSLNSLIHDLKNSEGNHQVWAIETETRRKQIDYVVAASAEDARKLLTLQRIPTQWSTKQTIISEAATANIQPHFLVPDEPY